MHNNFLYTQEKKQAVNFIEQMTFCYISRGKKCWMDVLVRNENEELIEQLDSPILAINDFLVKEDPREYQKKMYVLLIFLAWSFFGPKHPINLQYP